MLLCKKICTWSLDTVTEVFSKVVNDVQQEGEVSHIVHVNVVRISGNRPQFILISILYTCGAKGGISILIYI